MVGTPDDSVEWCCLNFKDPAGARGVIIALQYGGTAVLRRDYFFGAPGGLGTYARINDHLTMSISVISTPAVSAAEARTDTELPLY